MINLVLFFNVTFFLNTIISFNKSLKKTLLLFLIISVISFVVLVFFYERTFSIFYYILILFLTLLSILSCHTVAQYFRQKHRILHNSLNKLKDIRKTTMNLDTKVLRENDKIKTIHLQSIETLYEGMKLMNSTLEFEETLQIASNLLQKLAHVTAGWLIIPEENTETDVKEPCYQLFHIGKIAKKVSVTESQLNNIQKTVLRKTVEKNAPLFVDLSELDHFFKGENLLGFHSVLAFPLNKQDKFFGVLALFNCKKSDIEKIRILVIQLTMELEKITLYELVKELSVIDGLTKLYLKTHLFKLLDIELERLKQQKKPLSLLMIDIDHFKKINDTYGHLVGDRILQHLSQLMRDNFREIDIMSRYGGEEFIIALPNLTKAKAHTIAERFREQVEQQQPDIYGNKIACTISIGIASFPGNAKTPVKLIEKADKALYKAKNSGRNRVEVA